MSNQDCGSCDYQGAIQRDRAECRVDSKWRERGFRCDDFKDYDHSKTQEERLKQAIERKREREATTVGQWEREFAERMAQREREYAEGLANKDREHATELQKQRMEFDARLWKASWWWQLALVIGGALLGFITNLLL
jgi:hypothetical protein